MLLENTGKNIENPNKVKVYLAPMGKEELYKAFELTCALRKEGITADFDHMSRGIKAQFKYADKIGAKFVAVIGSNELSSGVVKVKNMQDGTETDVAFDNFIDFVK